MSRNFFLNKLRKLCLEAGCDEIIVNDRVYYPLRVPGVGAFGKELCIVITESPYLKNIVTLDDDGLIHEIATRLGYDFSNNKDKKSMALKKMAEAYHCFFDEPGHYLVSISCIRKDYFLDDINDFIKTFKRFMEILGVDSNCPLRSSEQYNKLEALETSSDNHPKNA